MSVKRYDFDCYAFYDSARLSVNECEDGDYVLHSDYADLLARHNALMEAVKEYMRADDAWYRAFQCGEPDEIIFQGNQAEAARAEVDRLLQENN